MNIEKARFNMVEQQVKPWNVNDERLLGAMASLPREQFVPEAHRNLAYADTAIPLCHNQAMLAPRELARMIQALELKGDERVLEIGCGTGYASVLLSKLAKKVYSVDIIAELVSQAREQVTRLALNNVSIEEVDAADGWVTQAPYDAILITSVIPRLTDSMKNSLSASGRIVTILGSPEEQYVNLCKPDKNGNWEYEQLFPVQAKPMINAEQPNQFVF